ncbi:MAG: hypothetical protein JXR51_14635 [Bacteroidales bacterium]|nr:hypothetical protein [Bacteroidales bacterium]MBN2758407.1 hypothetical protein [Bacteroidales bacterium]
MKKVLNIIFLFFLIAINSFAQKEQLIEGVYQGENLFVMNPFASTGVGFCVYEVTVNNEITTDEINSSAFEIDLSLFQLKIGDHVSIIIKHKDNCTPKVLNLDVLKSKSTYKVVEIDVDRKNNKLRWTTTNENGSLEFTIEQFKWKKWVKIASVEGKGSSGLNKYSADIEPHSGLNKFRVKQIDFSKKPRYSPEATYRSLDPEVTFSPDKPKNEIIFSAKTDYEIYNYYGKLITKGSGDKVDVSKLKKGEYFINYDNAMGTFTKK